MSCEDCYYNYMRIFCNVKKKVQKEKLNCGWFMDKKKIDEDLKKMWEETHQINF